MFFYFMCINICLHICLCISCVPPACVHASCLCARLLPVCTPPACVHTSCLWASSTEGIGSWNWSHGLLGANMWVLGIEPRSLGRALTSEPCLLSQQLFFVWLVGFGFFFIFLFFFYFLETGFPCSSGACLGTSSCRPGWP